MPCPYSTAGSFPWRRRAPTFLPTTSRLVAFRTIFSILITPRAPLTQLTATDSISRITFALLYIGFAETPAWGCSGQPDDIRQNRKMALGLVSQQEMLLVNGLLTTGKSGGEKC